MKDFNLNLIVGFICALAVFSAIYAGVWLALCFGDLTWFNPFATRAGRVAYGFVIIGAAYSAVGFARSEARGE